MTIHHRGRATVANDHVGTIGAAILLLSLPAAVINAHAQGLPLTGTEIAPQQGTVPAEPGFATGLWSRSNLLGDMEGLRTALGNYGISLGLQTINEVFANVSGGIKQGVTGDGLTIFSMGVDTKKAFGWDGGTFNASGLWIYGPNFSQGYLGTLQTSSGIVASPTVRLWELWYQQAFMDGKIDVKLGQQSLDQEFIVSTYSGLFLNTMMGWPMLPSANLYAGGPAYPLSSLGIRFRAQPSGPFTVLAGVFQDNPPGGPFEDDSQLRGSTRYGLNFNLVTGALFIGEIQYALNQPSLGEMSYGGHAAGLPGTYKLGFWYDTGPFPEQRLDVTGLKSGNYSFYGVVDQMVWRPDPQAPKFLGVFLRVMGAPADRNLIAFSANGGVESKAPLPTRDNDTAGIGFGVAKVSGAVFPSRGTETFIEATYQYQVAPWWQVQPDAQYIFNPGGGVPNPSQPGKRIGNAMVLAIRTIVTF